MVNVNFEQTKDGISIHCRGHAGYADYGKDIVCAGISALCIALEIALRKSGAAKKCDFYENINDGLYEINIRGIKDGEFTEMCKNYIYMFLSGMVFLQEHYPENICVKGFPTENAVRGTSQVPDFTERKEVIGWSFS